MLCTSIITTIPARKIRIPSDIDFERIKQRIMEVPEVESIHDPHLWTLDGSYHVVTVHIVFVDEVPREKLSSIKKKVREALRGMDIRHITVELEFEGEECVLVDC